MNEINWAGELCVAITVSDTSGKILYMNDKSAVTFDKNGGKELIGKNLRDCHLPEFMGEDSCNNEQPGSQLLHHRKRRHQETHLPGAVV